MNRLFAYIIIIAIAASTFIGVFAFTMVDTGEQDVSVGTAFNIVWGNPDGTMAVRFQLDNYTQIDRARIRVQHYKSLDPGNPTSFSLTPRITEDVSNSNAPAIVSFPKVDFDAIDGKRFYVENALNERILSPGTYKFVVDVHVVSGMAHRVQWLPGISNTGVAGSVFDGGYRDDGGTGAWSDDLQNPPWLWNLLLYGGITDDPSQAPTGETNGDISQVVSTTGQDDDGVVDTELASNVAIFGLLMLVLGFAFLAVGTKTNFAVVILGIIFLIIALLLIAWASFVLFGGG